MKQSIEKSAAKCQREERMTSEYIIKTQNVSKKFKKTYAVKDMSLSVRRNTVYGLLGPNGAGKSTLLKMITGIIRPTSGEIQFCGHPWKRKDLSVIGSLIESPPLYENLTAFENLKVRAALMGIGKNRCYEVLQKMDLADAENKKTSEFSLGMKQRLGLASALIGRPPILILDEPTNGLDPVGIHEIRTLIRSLPQKFDCTVLVSSHLLSEIELMADNIGILNHGHLLFEGTLEGLKFNAAAQGYPTDNLEDTFLALIDADNRQRGGAR